MTHLPHNTADNRKQKRILLVDDEERLIRSLGRRLRAIRPDWEILEANSAHAALELLQKEQTDLIVSDLLMPVMDGAVLLEQVREKYPSIIRFVLSGHAQKEIMLKATSVSHQYFSKPCDSEVLARAISDAFLNTDKIQGEQLKEVIVYLSQFPAVPQVYNELVSALKDGHKGADRISEIIRRDPGITSQVLHVANSSFFGSPHKINEVADAVLLVGTEAVRSVALMCKFLDTLKDTGKKTQCRQAQALGAQHPCYRSVIHYLQKILWPT